MYQNEKSTPGKLNGMGVSSFSSQSYSQNAGLIFSMSGVQAL